MGSAFSFVSSGTVFTVLVVAVAFAYGYHSSQIRQPAPESELPLLRGKSKHSSSLKKKPRKRQAVDKEVVTSTAEEDVRLPGSEPSTSSGVKSKSDGQKPTVVSFPTVIPGGFGGDTTASAAEVDTDAGSSGKPKKKKKGKGKKVATEGSGSGAQVEEKSDVAGPAESSTVGRSASVRKRQSQLGEAGGAGLDNSEAWTRVESRRKPKSQPTKSDPQGATSDAGITTSVTGNSSPVTDDETGPTPEPDASSTSKDNRRTLAEKLIPKPRKTGVEE